MMKQSAYIACSHIEKAACERTQKKDTTPARNIYSIKIIVMLCKAFFRCVLPLIKIVFFEKAKLRGSDNENGKHDTSTHTPIQRQYMATVVFGASVSVSMSVAASVSVSV